MPDRKKQRSGISAALLSAFFLGFAPVFGKQAILFGFSPIAVVAFRTFLAALLLFAIMLLTKRQFLYIYPVGLMGCLLAGGINGIGSLFYYMALGRLDAGLGQLLYATYPVFVALWLALDAQPPSRLTWVRIGLALLATALMTAGISGQIDWLGIGMMLLGAALYALHIPINQRILYEVPAPTVTLYTLSAMAAIVVPAYLLFDRQWPGGLPAAAWWPVLGLALFTFLSRLTLFMGVKRIGGMQTALLGLAELLITLLGSHLLLGERLTPLQWSGAALMAISLGLVAAEKTPPVKTAGRGGWLQWLRPPGTPPDLPGMF
jgi:drug/metabolite transporter (DMT)-like permease